MAQFRRLDNLAFVHQADEIGNVVMQRTGPVAPRLLCAVEAAFALIFRIALAQRLIDFVEMPQAVIGGHFFRPNARRFIEYRVTSRTANALQRSFQRGADLPRGAQLVNGGFIHQAQRLGWTAGYAGLLAGRVLTAKIALLRQLRRVVIVGHHLNGAKRTGDDAVFTADAQRLGKLNAVVSHAQRLSRARADAGGVVAVAAGRRAAGLAVEEHADARKKVAALLGPAVLAMRGDAGHFTGVAFASLYYSRTHREAMQ